MSVAPFTPPLSFPADKLILAPHYAQLKITNKDAQLVTFEPNWAQSVFLHSCEHQLRDIGRIRILILKARQLGLSTASEALMFTLAKMIDNFGGMVVAHETAAARGLFAMLKRYEDNWPLKGLFEVTSDSKKEIEWRHGSSVLVATAGKRGSSGVGRSKTIRFVHASEFAFWPDPVTALTSLLQSIPTMAFTGLIIESTANGVGNHYYDMWNAAVAGESDFLPLFFPWWRHPEYVAEAIGWQHVRLTQMTSDERDLQALGVSRSALIWRRYALRNLAMGKLDVFRQEYPATPEEAFLSTGSNVFSFEHLQRVFKREPGVVGHIKRDGERIFFERDPQGPFTMFRQPNPDKDFGQYVVAGDPTHGINDFGCAQVLNRRTHEQVGVWRGRIDAFSFSEILRLLGHFYNDALVSAESEGPGLATVGGLVQAGYPFLYQHERQDKHGNEAQDAYGWRTTSQTKPLAIAHVAKDVIDRACIIHDTETFVEHKNYVKLPNGSYGPASAEGHDDTVMSFAQGIAVSNIYGRPQAYSTVRDSRRPDGIERVDILHSPHAPPIFVTSQLAEDLDEEFADAIAIS